MKQKAACVSPAVGAEPATEPAPGPSRGGLGGLFVWGLLGALLYVLSLGPAILAYNKGWFGPKAEPVLQTFYAPLIWLHESTPLRRPLAWYVDLWD